MPTTDISLFRNLLRAGARQRGHPNAGIALSARLAALHANHQFESLQPLQARQRRERSADVGPLEAEASPDARGYERATAGRDAPT
jgi:hypothetical protein